MPRSIVIIGAGIGGLAAAVRLAHLGYTVAVVEKNARVGGRICELHGAGFRWNIGPPAFTARPQLAQLCNDIGRDLEDTLRLHPLDPQTRYFFPDGLVFNIRRDWAAAAAEIARLNPDDVAGFLRFQAFAARLHRMRAYGFGGGEPTFASLLRSWLYAGPFRSAQGAARRFVRSEKLQRALAHYASHSGGSPYSVPATFSELAHTHLNDGLWYPRDGLFGLAQALETLARELDVSFRLGGGVKSIAVERGRAVGVILESDDEILPADAVVSNVDPITTARYLLPEAAITPTTRRRLSQTPMSSSAFIMLLGVRGRFPQLAHYNVFFSHDARAEYDQVHRRGQLPDDPTITLTVSCKTDPQNAPGNQENWLIQVMAPPLTEKVNWATERALLRDRILAILERRYGLDLRDRIRIEKQLTPADLAAISGAWRGALYGDSPQGRGGALTGPQIRSPHARRLYQVGGAVIPGGGLPQALLSAREAAKLLRLDLK